MNRASTRRHCLQLLSAIVTSCLISTGDNDLSDSQDLERIREVLVSLLPNRVRLHAMVSEGARMPDRRQVAALLLTILGEKSLCEAASMSTAALRDLIVARIHTDFIQNHTACIDGWVLSMTEAHLYALVG